MNWKTVASRKSISERPSRVSRKKEVFHWEGDTIEGKGHMGGAATLVDMKTQMALSGDSTLMEHIFPELQEENC